MEPSNSFTLLIYIGFFCCAAFFAYLLNGLFLSFSRNLGIRNHDVSIIRWSSHSKPAFGGISFYILFLLSIACFNIFFEVPSIIQNKQLLGIMAATAVAFLMGLSDDAFNTKPLLKLSAQIGCGIILALTGTYISIFDHMILNYLLTIFWVVGVMNSINMLDNMDGITASVSLVIISTALMISGFEGITNSLLTFSMIGIIAALVGFLFYNWYPSRMFMGDTGSQFLGIFLAIIGIVFFWNFQTSGVAGLPSKQIIITLLAFIIPICDTSAVTVNRVLRGQSPMVGGKDHTTHHLSYLGLSDKQVARVLIILSVISCGLIYIITNFIGNWSFIYAGAFLIYFLTVFAFLFGITHIKKTRKKFYRHHVLALKNSKT